MKTQAAMKPRAGFSILELGIAVALSSLLMALVVTLFSAVLKAQRVCVGRRSSPSCSAVACRRAMSQPTSPLS